MPHFFPGGCQYHQVLPSPSFIPWGRATPRSLDLRISKQDPPDTMVQRVSTTNVFMPPGLIKIANFEEKNYIYMFWYVMSFRTA